MINFIAALVRTQNPGESIFVLLPRGLLWNIKVSHRHFLKGTHLPLTFLSPFSSPFQKPMAVSYSSRSFVLEETQLRLERSDIATTLSSIHWSDLTFISSLCFFRRKSLRSMRTKFRTFQSALGNKWTGDPTRENVVNGRFLEKPEWHPTQHDPGMLGEPTVPKADPPS